MRAVEANMERIEIGRQRLADSVTMLSLKIDMNNKMTQELVDFTASVKGFARVVMWIGRAINFCAKFVVLPVVAIYSIGYALFHGGTWPSFWSVFVKGLL